MGKKKRSINQNLKYSRASKIDEGKRILEEVSMGDLAEVRVSMAGSPAMKMPTTRSSKPRTTRIVVLPSPPTLVTEVYGGTIVQLGSKNGRGYCSSGSSSPDLLSTIEGLASMNSKQSGGDAGATSTSFERGAGAATVIAKAKLKPRNHCTTNPTSTPINGDLGTDLTVNKGPLHVKGKKLGFVCPIMKNGVTHVQLQKSELQTEHEKWKNSLVLYVIGEKPSFNAIRKYAYNLWSKFEPQIYLHDEGYFLIKFGNEGVMQKVVKDGPYWFRGKPVMVKPWIAGFNFHNEVVRCVPVWLRFPNLPLDCWLSELGVPVWVRFPNLPLDCWSSDSLSRIGSALGVPICSDECTNKQARISYARVLVEVDVTKPMPTEIPIQGADEIEFKQKVIFEGVPKFCVKCNRVGHDCGISRAPKGKSKNKSLWKPKKAVEHMNLGNNEKEDVTTSASMCQQQDQPQAVMQRQIDDRAHEAPLQRLQQGQTSNAEPSLVQQQGNIMDWGVLEQVDGGREEDVVQQQQVQGSATMQHTPIPQQQCIPSDEQGQSRWPGADQMQQQARSDATMHVLSPSYANITKRKHKGALFPP